MNYLMNEHQLDRNHKQLNYMNLLNFLFILLLYVMPISTTIQEKLHSGHFKTCLMKSIKYIFLKMLLIEQFTKSNVFLQTHFFSAGD